MAQLAISDVVNVSVSAAGAGAGAYNTSNLAIFTSEVPASSFGTLGYALYTSASQVATDFGTGSQTYAEALQVFSQQPNILAGGGYLVVIPFLYEVQQFTFSGTPASGSFQFAFGGSSTAAIQYNASASSIQTAVQGLPGLASATVVGTISASTSLSVSMQGTYGAQSLMTVVSNSMQTAGSSAVTVTGSHFVVGETLGPAITRTSGLVQYFGLMGIQVFSQADMLAAAAVVQGLNKIAFFTSYTAADVQPGGMLDMLRTGSFTQSRGLFYGGTSATALGMMSAYAGRALSVNFSGSNTTITMHLKDLVGVQPDPSMTETLLAACQAAGADIYASFQGVPKTFTSGANQFFDYVYNLQWFVGAIQIAGFNYLAQSSTKIPQTEAGMSGLKGAYRTVCEQAVTNQYVAAGTWNSPDTFGIQSDFLQNISGRGYYIYSAPIAAQLAADRAARKAPLAQIALKLAGAIQSSSVLIYINK
jgi:hypothetical protein